MGGVVRGCPCKLVCLDRGDKKKKPKNKKQQQQQKTLGKVLPAKADLTTCVSSYLKECQENFRVKLIHSHFKVWGKVIFLSEME